jgi:pyruvate ferredoxin oxidoreductase beta subunit
MPTIAAAHNIPYVATACISYPLDLAKKVRKGLTSSPAYIQVLAPCPTGWRYDPNLTIKIGELAVQTGYYPLYEIEKGKVEITVEIAKRKPIIEFLELQGRFRYMSEREIEVFQQYVNEQCKALGIP